MEFSEWTNQNEKPDFNGVYQFRDTSKPDGTFTYSLYKNGWHVECATIEDAYRATAKAGSDKELHEVIGTSKVFKVNRYGTPNILEWRGLAKITEGETYTQSDKWSRI